jgi:hypothetical protein
MHVLEPEAYQPNSASDRPIPPAETAPPPCSPSSVIPLADADTRVLGRESQRPKKRAGSRMRIEGADNSTLVEPRRSRDKDHLRFIAVQPCTVCGRQPCEAHHLRFAQPRALGRRVSDEFTVPLCRVHHRELHRQGDERVWWNKGNIDPMPVALRFWQHTRGIVPTASYNHEPQYPKTDVANQERSGAGAPSNGNLPSELFDVADGRDATRC